jgi:very-short-patch-repair endonuclease
MNDADPTLVVPDDWAGEFPEAEGYYLDMAAERARSLRRELEDFSKSVCESEIERRLLVCMQMLFVGSKLGKSGYCLLVPPGDTVDFAATEADRIISVIRPQHQVHKYRADFVVQRAFWDSLAGREIRTPEIVVECDGHDYHERTSEQAQHDKSRDRALASLGYTVVRFTGSEIFNRAAECAWEISELLAGLIDKKRMELALPWFEAGSVRRD